MYRWEVSYKENGILKNRGFKSKEAFDKFMRRLAKKSGITCVRTVEDWVRVGW